MDLGINEKLEQAQQGVARLIKIDSMIQQLKLEQSKLESKAAELKDILNKENYDVEKIENKSIASVFYSMLGKLEEQVDKERREALAANLKYSQAVKDLEDVKYQITKLSSERLNYVNCQQEYDLLYAEKKEQLMKEPGESAQKILELTGKLNFERINLKEIKEAIIAGRKVLDSLDSTLESLGHAEGWGIWDILGGGPGFFPILKSIPILTMPKRKQRTHRGCCGDFIRNLPISPLTQISASKPAVLQNLQIFSLTD